MTENTVQKVVEDTAMFVGGFWVKAFVFFELLIAVILIYTNTKSLVLSGISLAVLIALYFIKALSVIVAISISGGWAYLIGLICYKAIELNMILAIIFGIITFIIALATHGYALGFLQDNEKPTDKKTQQSQQEEKS